VSVWPFSRSESGGFAAEADILEAVRHSNNFDPQEDVDEAEAFVIFERPDERRWLVVTRLRIYSVVDRPGEGPRIEWSISRSKIFSEGRYVLEVRVSKDGDRDMVDIGYRKRNPFNPRLIPGGIDQRIRGAVMRRMRPDGKSSSP